MTNLYSTKATALAGRNGSVATDDSKVSLDITLDLPQAEAEELVNTAHQVCPYSNAVRNNIDVQIAVTGIA